MTLLVLNAKGGWTPRDAPDLATDLSRVYGFPVEIGSKRAGLTVVAAALQSGEIARAQIAASSKLMPTGTQNIQERVPLRVLAGSPNCAIVSAQHLSRCSENEAADGIIRRLYAKSLRLRISELFAEVHGWSGFADRLAHLRTGAPPDDARALMTAVLADAIHLGLIRMARSAGDFSHSRLLWIAEWHVRDETYQAALACLVDAIHAQPFNEIWGDGDTSSSDGRFFRAGGHREARADFNAKYGSEPGAFYSKVISAFAACWDFASLRASAISPTASFVSWAPAALTKRSIL